MKNLFVLQGEFEHVLLKAQHPIKGWRMDVQTRTLLANGLLRYSGQAPSRISFLL